MSNEKEKIMQEAAEAYQRAHYDDKQLILGYMLGKQQEREEWKKKMQIDQKTA